MVYSFTLPYTLTFSKLFNRSRQLAIGMRDKLLICGMHLLGEYYLSPEIPIVSVKVGYQSTQERESTAVSFSMALCENNSIYI